MRRIRLQESDGEQTDRESVEQAKLNIGFRVDVNSDEERMALNVANQMFGGSATSYD